MELSELTQKFSELLKISDVKSSPEALMLALSERKTEICYKWSEICPDMSTDWLQPIFQYYMADRKVKMQDYTPKSLAKLCAKLAGISAAKSCYDMCAGSGALTIQAWNINKECLFICEEFDERVIPFLIFNLAIRNINAIVIHGDVLSEEKFKAYELKSGDKYSEIRPIEPPKNISADVCISNPPYNIKWKQDCALMFDSRFTEYGVPPKSNANYVFVLTALRNSISSCLILPNSILDGSALREEVQIRENLVRSNKINGIVLCPDKMFEATAISTCLICLSNTKNTASSEMIDARNTYQKEKRLQKGQFGSKAHTNRVYEKIVKVFSDEQEAKIVTAMRDRMDTTEFSKCVSIEDIKANRFGLSPTTYIEMKTEELKHRTYKEIIADINRIRTERNTCKLIINETLAKKMGFDVELYKIDSLNIKDLEDFYKNLSGEKIVKSDYITFTKNKNELVFKNNSSENVSTILQAIMQMWKQHCMYLNNQENIFLAELRDALIPDLMSGKIDVNEVLYK